MFCLSYLNIPNIWAERSLLISILQFLVITTIECILLYQVNMFTSIAFRKEDSYLTLALTVDLIVFIMGQLFQLRMFFDAVSLNLVNNKNEIF
jgi:hypothetical protein